MPEIQKNIFCGILCTPAPLGSEYSYFFSHKIGNSKGTEFPGGVHSPPGLFPTVNLMVST